MPISQSYNGQCHVGGGGGGGGNGEWALQLLDNITKCPYHGAIMDNVMLSEEGGMEGGKER